MSVRPRHCGRARRTVSFRNLTIMQVANTFAATTTPAGVGGLALSMRFLQNGGLGAVRATAAVALQQTVQVITHVGLLILFSVIAGTSAEPVALRAQSTTVLYLVGGCALGIVGISPSCRNLRRWLGTEVRPRPRRWARTRRVWPASPSDWR